MMRELNLNEMEMVSGGIGPDDKAGPYQNDTEEIYGAECF